MPLITINGQFGTGAPEIGAEAARLLRIDYVDRSILAEAAKRLGATEEALAELEQRPLSRVDRIARFLQSALERSATAGTGGDPYFGPGLGTMLGREYVDVTQEPGSRADGLDDREFIEGTRAVITEVAEEGDAVIIGRASNVILQDFPGAFHVGLVASLQHRIGIIAARENLPEEEAEQRTNLQEKAREAFFRKFFKVQPDDPAGYHLILNTDRLNHEKTAAIIVSAVTS